MTDKMMPISYNREMEKTGIYAEKGKKKL